MQKNNLPVVLSLLVLLTGIAFSQEAPAQKDLFENQVADTVVSKRISRSLQNYRFELELTSHHSGLGQADSFTQKLFIYHISNGNAYLISDIPVPGKLTQPSSAYDSVEAGHFNFDGIPDVRIYSSLQPEKKRYYLSYLNEEHESAYYFEKFFSNLTEVHFDSTRKQVSGILASDQGQTVYTFYGPGPDTVRIDIRYNSSPHTINTFLYERGKLRKSIANSPAEKPARIKEFGDYNFDGTEDFCIANEKDPYRFDFYLFDSTQNSYRYMPLLSKMDETFFDWENKTFRGLHRYRDNGTSYTDDYEFRNGKFVIVRRMTSTQVSPPSEKVYQEYYELKEGKLTLVTSGYVD